MNPLLINKLETLPVASRVLNISHSDLDGVSASTLLNAFFKKQQGIVFDIKLAAYHNIDEILTNLKTTNPYDMVIVTDISPKNPESLKDIPNLVLIDHHETAKYLHDPENFIYVWPDQELCGAALVFRELIYGNDEELSKRFQWLVSRTNDYDLWIHKHPESKKLSILFDFYWEKFIYAFEDGHKVFRPDELEWIKKREDALEDQWKAIELVDIADDKPWKFFITEDFVSEMGDRLLNLGEVKLCLILCTKRKNPTLSIRHRYENLHAGNMLKDLGLGGGHAFAAGCSSDHLSSPEEIMKCVSKVSNHLISEGY